MPVVFVHGNPETAAIWEPLIAALGRQDVTCLSPPGFGAPVPEGWGATRQEYQDWLVGELESLGAPVDLVGHDWGGGHVVAVAVARPDLLRSWCTDIAGVFDPDYVWHDLAQAWQAPDEGEAAIAGMLVASVEDRAAFLAGAGVPLEVGRRLAAAFDETMGRCILALYRSAAQPAMTEFGQGLPAAAARPGLVIVAEQDTYVGTEAMARRAADRAGAAVEVLPEVGHWWMLQDPDRGAEVLTRFWTSLPAPS